MQIPQFTEEEAETQQGKEIAQIHTVRPQWVKARAPTHHPPLPSSVPRLPPNTPLPPCGPGCPWPLALLPPAALHVVNIFNLARRTRCKSCKRSLWLIIFSSRSPSKALREGIETEGPVDKWTEKQGVIGSKRELLSTLGCLTLLKKLHFLRAPCSHVCSHAVTHTHTRPQWAPSQVEGRWGWTHFPLKAEPPHLPPVPGHPQH